MKTIEPTSLEAYKNMQSKIPGDKEMILSVLSETQSKTYQEIGRDIRIELHHQNRSIEALKWINPNKVSRRTLELVKDDKAILGKVRKCTIAKSNCKTYLLKSET